MMDKQERINRAREMFIKGFNCAQATAAPFFDIAGTDEKTLIKASSAFGGGVARLRNVCGVVSGIALVFGLSHTDIDVSDTDAKERFYEDAQALIKGFSEKYDTVICAELLDMLKENPPQDMPYCDKPCLKLVEDGAELLCKYFEIE